MTRAIRVHTPGGPEALRWEEVTLAPPGPGEALVRHSAVGLNYIDVYFREGQYAPGSLPFTPGMEGVGVVEEIVPPDHGLKPGDRVGYPLALGAYSERRIVASSSLLLLPPGVEDVTAAALLPKGLTARYLLKKTHEVRAGEVVLVHAAAGGVGQILSGWARALGATVIGTVGSDAKTEAAAAAGCEHPINYSTDDFVGRVMKLTEGRGVDVIYDGVGRATFARSLACLKERGLMVSFGAASGAVPPIDVRVLMEKALYLARPSLATFVKRRDELEDGAADLFDAISRGFVKPAPPCTLPLHDAASAHRMLEARETIGATVLVPDGDGGGARPHPSR